MLPSCLVHPIAHTRARARHATRAHRPCPAGRYGGETGLKDATCSGQCTAGYYCPHGSSSPTAEECGGAHLYCPTGSAAPTPVTLGFYSTPATATVDVSATVAAVVGNEQTRTGQTQCAPGQYCDSSGVAKPCPAGRYGATTGLTTALCSGPCAKGHYCLEASTKAHQYPCPQGTYGDVSGLADAACSGPCAPEYDCKHGSTSQYGRLVGRT